MSAMKSANAISATLVGVPELYRRVRMMDGEVYVRTRRAIRRGTEAVVSTAKTLVPRRTGELESTIRAEFSKDEMTGYAKAGYGKLLRRSRASSSSVRYEKAKARRAQRQKDLLLATSSKQAFALADLGVYAMVVEYGDKKRNKPRLPFMGPAFWRERPAIVRELRDALQGAANRVAA